MRILLAAFLMLSSISQCFGFAAIAVGRQPNGYFQFTSVNNRISQAEADDSALVACIQRLQLSDCHIIARIANTCTIIASDHETRTQIFRRDGDSIQDARIPVLSECQDSLHKACIIQQELCDSAPPPQPQRPLTRSTSPVASNANVVTAAALITIGALLAGAGLIAFGIKRNLGKLFVFLIGAATLSVVMFASGQIASGIGILVVAGLTAGAYEKLVEWGLITPWKPTVESTSRSIAPAISNSLKPIEPVLPPPNPPAPATTPVKGLMRVDITRTNKTVDVYITLSEKAAFLLKTQDVSSIAIERNFEDFSAHMATFKRRLRGAFDETDSNIAGQLSGEVRENWEKMSAEWRREDKAREPEEIAEEEERYKARNTVYLSDYLKYPYRKIVDSPLEASTYMKRLETEYLPKIKAALEGATPGTISFEL